MLIWVGRSALFRIYNFKEWSRYRWPKPKNPKALQGFLGLMGYYWKLIICKNSHFTYQHVAKGIIFVVPNGKRSFSKTQGSNELSPSIISPIFLKLSLLSVMPPILVQVLFYYKIDPLLILVKHFMGSTFSCQHMRRKFLHWCYLFESGDHVFWGENSKFGKIIKISSTFGLKRSQLLPNNNGYTN